MRIVLHTPAPPLDQLVRLWSCEAPELGNAFECSLPTGNLMMFVNLAEDELRWYDSSPDRRCHRTRGATLGGMRAHSYLIDTRQLRHVVGATFLTGGAHPFFSAPIAALQGEHLPHDAVWGRSATAISARLLEAPTAVARLAVLEAILREQLVRPPTRQPAIDLAVARLGDCRQPWSVAQLRERLGVTTSRLLRLFADHVGLTPKRWSRLQRFHHALRTIDRAEHDGFAALAVACGYFDQAHFIHDFRAFAGTTPAGYVARQAPPPHIRIDLRL